MKVTLKYLVVLLRRNNDEQTPLVVLPHEVPVLMALHGDAAILESKAEPHTKEATFDTEEEWARLQGLYRGNDQVANPTLVAFRNFEEFEDSFTADDEGESKTALLEQAKELGIKANKNWGVEKLQAAIDEALAK